MAQTLSPDSFELILVQERDAASRDENHVDELTERLLKSFRPLFSLRMLPVSLPPDFQGHTAGYLRNRAAETASGDFLVFIDSDVIPHPQCLEHFNDAIQNRGNKTAFYGVVSELPASKWSLLGNGYYASFEALYAASWIDHRAKKETNPLLFQPNEAHWMFFYTSCAAVSKADFLDIGGFDESGFRCHDLDFSCRLQNTGYHFGQVTGARAIHIEHPRSIGDIADQMKGLDHLAKKFPGLHGYLQDKIILHARRQETIGRQCEKVFQNFTKGLTGKRAGYAWVLPLNTDLDHILTRKLEDFSFVTRERGEVLNIYLRLHRNCWDYHLLVPKIDTSGSPSISIVVPVFNAAGTLARCLESVLGQTIQNFEVLLIDDCSSDQSLEICHAFVLDQRIRVITLDENRGLSYILNKGLELAASDLLLQLDSDDWLEPNALERIIGAFNERPEIGAVYSDPIIHRKNRKKKVDGYQVQRPEEFFTYPYPQVARAYRKKIALAAGGWQQEDAYKGRYYEDRLMLATLAKYKPVIHLREHLYNVDEGERSLSRRDPLETASAKIAVLYDQANLSRSALSVQYEHNFLRAGFTPFRRKKPTDGWSVVIPFYYCRDLLRLSLQSWIESDLPPENSEIIIVDDSQEDMAPFQGLDRRIRVIRPPYPQGAGFARNFGALASRFPMLLFSDADHIVPPDVIARHEDRHRNAPIPGAVEGCVFGKRVFTVVYPAIAPERKAKLLLASRFDKKIDTIARQISLLKEFNLIDPEKKNVWNACKSGKRYTEWWLWNNGKILLRYGAALTHYPFKWAILSGAHFSISKEIFKETGGFDGSLSAFEDFELGIRIQKAGYSIAFAPELEPFHQVHPVNPSRHADNIHAIGVLKQKYPDYIDRILSNPEDTIPPPSQSLIKNILNNQLASIPVFDPAAHTASPLTAITVDDGPHPYGSIELLKKLKKHRASATFFVIGDEAAKYPDLIKRIYGEGHQIGVHAWMHGKFTKLTTVEALDSLSRCMEVIYTTTAQVPKFARPPYGILSHSYLIACQALQLTPVGWTVSTKDWQFAASWEIISNLALSYPAGNVYLFHDGVGDPKITARSLDWLLQVCKEGGIDCVDLDTFSSSLSLPEIKLSPYSYV